jgi:hypothetical protein
MSGVSNAGEIMHFYPEGYFNSYLKNCISLGRQSFVPGGMGTFPLTSASNSWYATTPDDMEWWLAKAAANNALYYLEGSIEDWKKNGQTEEVLEKVRNWEKLRLSELLTLEQRKKMEHYFTSFRLATGPGDWSITPVTRKWEYLHADFRGISARNDYKEQSLNFELEPMGRMEYNDLKNIPLLPADQNEMEIPTYLHVTSADGKFDSHRNYRYQPAKSIRGDNKPPELAEFMEIMGAGTTGKRTGEAGKDFSGNAKTLRSALTLTATNYEGTPSWQTFMTYNFPEPYDFSQHRGFGVQVTGDGKGEYLFFILKSDVFFRCYFVKVDFTGKRSIEIPSYRCMLEGMMDELYNGIWKEAPLSPWLAIKRGFDFTQVDGLYMGFMGIHPNDTVTCTIESPQMLHEYTEPLINPVMLTSTGKLRINGTVNFGEFLCYEGGDMALIRDANRNILRKVPIEGGGNCIPKGEFQLSISAMNGDDQWVRLQMKYADEPFAVANPSASDKELLRRISNYFE